jgi:hypothetical protein
MEIPPLLVGTILLVEVGSTAHGTGLPGGEDNDEMGVVIEDPALILGLNDVGFSTIVQRTQPEGSRWPPTPPGSDCDVTTGWRCCDGCLTS